MQLPLKITFRNLECSDSLEQIIHLNSEKLNQIYPQIVELRVIVESTHIHRQVDNLYEVHIDLKTKEAELATSVNSELNHFHTDVYAAVRLAFNKIQKELHDYYTVNSLAGPHYGNLLKTALSH